MSANLHITHYNITHASRIFKIAESLINNNLFDYLYIVGLSDNNTSEKETNDSKKSIYRIKLSTRNLPKNIFTKILKYLEFTVRIIVRYRNKNINFVNCHSIVVLPIGLLFKLIYGSKLIYDTHELETETKSLNGIKKSIAKLVERLSISFIDHTFVVSNSIADEYACSYNMKRPSVIMNYPIFISRIQSNYFREKFKIKNDSRIFIYQGIMSEGRGIPLILETFSILNNQTKNNVVFLGYGPLKEKILEYSSKYNNIHYHDAVPLDYLNMLTSSADIGLSLIEGTCLSYKYCLPNKLFQYIMAGLPVIVSDLPELTKIVNSYNIGYVFKGDESFKLKALIESIDGTKINQMKKNTNIAAKKYNWKEQEKKLIGSYMSVLK